MSRIWKCSRGHQWEGPPDQASRCPQCGDTVDSVSSLADEELATVSGEFALWLGPGLAAMEQTHSAAASKLPAIPGYEIESELDRGGMGVVYKAIQTRLKRPVALKMILSGAFAGPADRDRFRREAEALGKLRHPNIVQIYEVGEHEGKPFFSMEFVTGGNLAQRIGGQPWSPAQAAELVEILTRAMHAAHQAGLVHRDLKPGNILLDNTAEPGMMKEEERASSLPFITHHSSFITPKITDFGLAKHLEETAGPTPSSGAILGTPSYMAPEQAAGKSKLVGPATDVYALGAILYELLTGRPPFVASSQMEVIMQVVADPPPAPGLLRPGLPRDVTTICLKCLEKEQVRRYRTALELAEDLSRFRRHEPIAARPIGRAERAVRWCRRKPVVAALLALVALVTLIGFAGITWKWLEADDNFAQSERRRLEAERNLALAIQTNLSVTNLATELKPLAGTQVQTVKRLLQQAEQNYVRLLTETGDIIPALEGKATMLNSFVDVYLALNDVAGARERAQQATDIWRRLIAGDGDNPQYQSHLARSLSWLGHTQKLHGNIATAAKTHAEAVAIYARWPPDDRSASDREDHALALTRLADALWEQDARGDAEKTHRDALKIREQLVRDKLRGNASRFHLAQSKAKLADVVSWTYDFPATLALLKDARGLMDALVTSEPDNAEFRAFLWDLHRQTARIQAEAGDARSATSSYEQALKLGAGLCELDKGNLHWQRKQLLTRLDKLNLAPEPERLNQSNRLLLLLREHVPELEKECALLRELVQRDPHNVEVEMNLAAREMHLARVFGVLAALDDPASAHLAAANAWFDSAVKRQARLAALEPDRHVFATAAADVRYDAAFLLWLQGKKLPAAQAQLAALEQKKGIYDQFVRKRPGELPLLALLAEVELQIGEKRSRLAAYGDMPEQNLARALEALHVAAGHYRQLVEQRPENLEWLGYWQSAHVEAAKVLGSQRKLDARKAELQALNAVTKRLEDAKAKAPKKSAEAKPAPVALLSQIAINLLYQQEEICSERDNVAGAEKRYHDKGYHEKPEPKEAERLIYRYWRLAESLSAIPASAYRTEASQSLRRGLELLKKLRAARVPIPDIAATIGQFESAIQDIEKRKSPAERTPTAQPRP